MSLHKPTHSAHMYTPGPAPSRCSLVRGFPQKKRAWPAALRRRRCRGLMQHASSFSMAGMLTLSLPSTRRADGPG
jgi:hypothetical protein